MNSEEARLALAACRREIDEIDRRLVAMLNERSRVVERIGEIKSMVSMPVYEPQREEEVFANVEAANQGPLSREAVKRLYERIIDEMRTMQRTRMGGK
jgi:chorismate mutase-like protein